MHNLKNIYKKTTIGFNIKICIEITKQICTLAKKNDILVYKS